MTEFPGFMEMFSEFLIEILTLVFQTFIAALFPGSGA
jgi:hypothetical protein